MYATLAATGANIAVDNDVEDDNDDCNCMDDDENIDDELAVDLMPLICGGNRRCDLWQSLLAFSFDVNDAVVVIGNENALWCDTVNGCDVITEKLFAATTAEETKKY